MSHTLKQKGCGDGWIAKKMAAEVDDLGYKDVKIVVKNDQEASIVEVQGAIRRARDAQTVMENSPVGDSQSNGLAERAVRRLQ